MANVELVIEIPKDKYNLILLSNKIAISEFVSKEAMMYAIRNGILLPKGHGRLDDIDKLQSIFHKLCDAYHIDNMAFMAEMDMYFDLDCRPSIIEADKEE